MHDEIIAYVQGLKAAGKKIPVSFLKAYRGEKAEIIAANYYRSLGYLVEDFSEVPGHPFDLKVTRPDGTSFNVEVKGTYSIHERSVLRRSASESARREPGRLLRPLRHAAHRRSCPGADSVVGVLQRWRQGPS